MGIGGQSCEPIESEKKVWEMEHSTGKSYVVLHAVNVARGMTYDQALSLLKNHPKKDMEGFYVARQVRIKVFFP